MAEITACRSCGAGDLHEILSLGETPLADGLLRAEDLDRPESRYPLDLAFCRKCQLVQIRHTVPPHVLFGKDYPYYSSFSGELVEHSRQNAEQLIARRGLGSESLVVEIASNDGYLLQHFARRGIPVLGIDPAPGPARAAGRRGVRTICGFFTWELADRLRRRGWRADVVVANNVLAHVPDQNAFLAGIASLLQGDGVASIEVPYVRDLIEKCEFDTIYHEHMGYFSVASLDAFFARHGLVFADLERLDIHGGSLRARVRFGGVRGEAVTAALREEHEAGLHDVGFYRDFGRRVQDVCRALRELLGRLRAEGRSIAAYGAAAKGATLLNVAGIGRDLIDFVVDRNVHKQGLFMPGARLPIHPPEKLLEERPDFVLLLAWNFRDEILRQQAEYRAGGGRFIVPVPRPEVI